MARVEVVVNIEAPISEVYRVSQDYSVRYEWDPFPENISLMHGAKNIEKGVSVSVKGKNGLYMEVEFIQVKPPTNTAIVMRNGPFFLESFSGSWVFKEESNNLTHAKFVYSIEMKAWSIPLLSEKLAVSYFTRVVESRLNGLKKYCESRCS